MGAKALANNLFYHGRTKHIEIDVHYVRNLVFDNRLEVRHISTVDQPADAFTKALSPSRLNALHSKLTIQPLLSLRGSIEVSPSNDQAPTDTSLSSAASHTQVTPKPCMAHVSCNRIHQVSVTASGSRFFHSQYKCNSPSAK